MRGTRPARHRNSPWATAFACATIIQRATRACRYVRGRSGTVIRVNGFYLLEDSDKAGLGPEPQPVYMVRFTAQELWGPAVAAPDSVCAELWQGYLERGTAPRKGDGNAQT